MADIDETIEGTDIDRVLQDAVRQVYDTDIPGLGMRINYSNFPGKMIVHVDRKPLLTFYIKRVSPLEEVLKVRRYK